MPLRKQRIGQRENHIVGIGHKTAQGALGNEMGIMIERQKDVDRAGADRKRRPDRRSAARRSAVIVAASRNAAVTAILTMSVREIKVGGHLEFARHARA